MKLDISFAFRTDIISSYDISYHISPNGVAFIRILLAAIPSLVVRIPGVVVIRIPYGLPILFALRDAVLYAGTAPR